MPPKKTAPASSDDAQQADAPQFSVADELLFVALVLRLGDERLRSALIEEDDGAAELKERWPHWRLQRVAATQTTAHVAEAAILAHDDIRGVFVRASATYSRPLAGASQLAVAHPLRRPAPGALCYPTSLLPGPLANFLRAVQVIR